MKRKEVNSARTPVYKDAGFELFDAETTAGAFIDETKNQWEPDSYIYSRYRNPTVVSAEQAIKKIEGCNWSLITQSGMSAIDTALSIFQVAGNNKPWLFFTEIYGGTISFVESVLKSRRGIEAQYFNSENGTYDLAKFEEVLKVLKPALVYIETISNPMLIVTDVTEIVRISKKYDVRVIVDNTFATPALYKPLQHGADIVVHSATKYYSGHGNITAGVVCGNDPALMQSAIEYRKFVGHTITADEAYNLQTQTETFHLRYSRQCDNAAKLSGFLASSPAVSGLFFPGLTHHPTHNIARKLFEGHGFGAMITFDLAGKDKDEKRQKRDKFISSVSVKIKLIPTLGDPHTILMPIEAVWTAKYPEPGMIRLSVGYEDYDDLLSTVKEAISNL
jgi:cystathionine beta-lyase/cystathionine gamma-synthase